MPARRSTPKLTFVLVVHGEQAYLEECTASLLGQDFDGVELVAVDDASPDHAPELLDELAARDPRVRVLHLQDRVGLGEARNLALAEAAGDYVWFVHTTDVLRRGALPAIARRLRAVSPDVLLVHHSRTDPLGRTRQGPHRRLLAAIADAGTVTLEQRPAVADAAPRAWNKVLRRELLSELDVRFGARGHSELSVTWPAFLTAAAIAASPHVGYIRRRPANAVRDGYTEGSPFDVFAACDAVLGRADVPDERRRLVLPAMLRQQLSLLDRMPEADRREFFHRMSESYRRHRRGDEPAPRGRLGRLQSALVERDGYRAFRLLEESLDARRALRKRRAALSRIRGRAAGRARRADLQRHYRSALQQPLDPQLAVYAAYWYRGYSCNPRAIYEKARELAPAVRGVWVVKREAAASMPPGVDYVVPGTREYYDAIARAGTFVNNVNFPNYLVKREGSVHVMTHHGTPLKRMGLDLRQHPVTGRRMDFAALLRRCERWDYSISSNPFSTLVWERVYPTRYESLEVGYPRNDVLANASDEDVRRARAELGIEPGQVAVLYAPTHREYQLDYTPVVDLAAVVDALGPDHVVLARLHYLYGADPLLRKLHRAGRLRDVAAHPSIEELSLAADVLVTDYSSLMFDYAVLDRPIVIHAPDWDAYRTLRGTYFDLMAEPPGVVTTTERELVEALGARTAWDEDATRARTAFRARFCSLEDGRAAERVVRRLWLGEREPAARPVASIAR
jgi:CDP-glycerol glycerophosphotransferase